MKIQRSRRSGLILLVVLGMLSLFSLLALSYMLVSSQSRASSSGMARRDFRGTPPSKLLDAAIRPVLRGTTDRSSGLSGHDLLGDVYGSSRPPVPLRIRRNAFGTGAPLAAPNFPVGLGVYPDLGPGHNERPLLVGGRFLRLPIVHGGHAVNLAQGIDNESPFDNPNPTSPQDESLPRDNDVWVGRVLTFLDGPLALKSVRVVRYIGDTRSSSTPEARDQCFSVLIDLGDIKDQLITHNAQTKSLEEWALYPSAAPALQGLSFCYDNPAGPFGPGARLLLNDAPFNSFGWGIGNNGMPQGMPSTNPPILPVALQPNLGKLGVAPLGDADEDYDAADYNNLFLSYRHQLAAGIPLQSQDVIPSFHRAALVNYIANWKNPLQYSEAELVETLRRIEAAVLRPLSYRVRTPNNGTLISNVNFTGGNRSSSSIDRSPQLDVVYDNNWGASGGGGEQFIQWIQWLTRGDWDVDNDADGVMDSIWIDPNLPLITSREGKLLKALVSYYIEDMESKLDMHASGSLNQALSTAPPINDAHPFLTATSNSFQTSGATLPQGFGYGPAEISLRGLFASDQEYRRFLNDRYGVDNLPGTNLRTFGSPPDALQDPRSALDERERNTVFRHGSLPGLPVGVRGMIGLGFDHFGNPLLVNSYQPQANLAFDAMFDQVTKDPYESRWRQGARGDNPFSWTAWERAYRGVEWDRSAMSQYLQTNPNSGGARLLPDAWRSLAPRTAHLRHASLAHPNAAGADLGSFRDLVQTIAARRQLPTASNAFNPNNYQQAFDELFPLEFHRAAEMNLNRPFGDGRDDDNDGQIDDPDELARFPQYARSVVNSPNGPVEQASGTIVEDYTLGVPFIDPQLAAEPVAVRNMYIGSASRQLYARHLYCLGMLILPDDLFASSRGAAVTGIDRARLIAQWAVNAVDFRDADSVMTRFAYDPEPFARTGNSGPFWDPTPGATPANVVWGMEQPEMLMTESLATHDVRAKDLEAGGGTMSSNPPDSDLDQYRVPEASLFLEFFNPRTTINPNDPSVPGVPGSMYTTAANGNTALNLSQLDALTGQSAVWRVGITPPHVANPNHAHPDSDSALLISQDLTNRLQHTYQISENSNLNGLAWDVTNPSTIVRPPPMLFDRVILFATPNNIAQARAIANAMPDLDTTGSTPPEARVYFNQQNFNVLLQGGQYLVVGPRAITYFGSKTELGVDPMTDQHKRETNNHRIVLDTGGGFSNEPPANANWANVYLHNNELVPRFQLRDCVTMIAGISDNDLFNTDAYPEQFIGINVSAPHVDRYYQAPTQRINTDDTNDGTDHPNGAVGYALMDPDGYDDFKMPAQTSPGTPFDSGAVSRFPLGTDTDPDKLNWLGGHDVGIPTPGTQTNWCTAFLQRLADPDRPFHATYNPYITVDWLPIDLTVFSGEEDQDITPGTFKFAARHKSGAPAEGAGEPTAFSTTVRGRTFLSYATDEPEQFTSTVTGTNFTEVLSVEPSAPTNPTMPNNNHLTFGYANSSFQYDRTNSSSLLGPFACAPQEIRSLLWPNRPFVNRYELAWVPTSSPGQLMQEFNIPAAAKMVYEAEDTKNHFNYLPNFFQELANPTGATGAAARLAMSPGALLELVTTPSPWQDTDDIIPPESIDPNSPMPPEVRAVVQQQMSALQSPYNRVSTFTEPGRVNLNTVAQEQVFDGLLRITNGNHTPNFALFKDSRRGYPDRDPNSLGAPQLPPPSFLPAPTNPHLSHHFPTQFAGVFKSTFSAGVVPPTRNPLDTSDPLFGAFATGVLDRQTRDNPVHSTLMRAAPKLVQAAQAGTPGVNQNFYAQSDDRALFSPAPLGTPIPNRPFSDYLPFTRLANLTTTRSNVFAVRVTVAFFEYNPSIPPGQQQPTGLGQEYGTDDGTAMRHRGFYVIDRSIPVGYQEGQDLNTDNCIIVRRIIE